MTDRLTWRNNGTWGVITLGLATIGYWLVTWLSAASRARSGEIDAVAADTSLPVKGLVVGAVIVVIGVVARAMLMPGKQSAP